MPPALLLRAYAQRNSLVHTSKRFTPPHIRTLPYASPSETHAKSNSRREIITLIVTGDNFAAAALLSKVSYWLRGTEREREVEREEEDESQRWSFQPHDCFAPFFPDSREKSSWKQLYEKREKNEPREAGRDEEKRSEKERIAWRRVMVMVEGRGRGGEREGGEGGRGRGKLWKAFPRLREKFVIENRGVYANVRAYLNETGTR